MEDISLTKASLLEISQLIEKLQEFSTSEVVLDPEIQEEIGSLLCDATKLKSEFLITQLNSNRKKMLN